MSSYKVVEHGLFEAGIHFLPNFCSYCSPAWENLKNEQNRESYVRLLLTPVFQDWNPMTSREKQEQRETGFSEFQFQLRALNFLPIRRKFSRIHHEFDEENA